MRAELADGSQVTYETGRRQHQQFCISIGVRPCPATENQLCLFATYLAKRGLRHATIKVYLGGVRHMHISLGHANPFDWPMERLRLLMKGTRRQSAKVRPEKKDLRRPVAPDTMRVLRQAWEDEEPRRNGRMLWAACCVGWFGFLRAPFDPALHLSLADLQVDNWRSPEWIKVRIKKSKTDPFRLGTTICLGKTGEDLCPVAAILSYLVERTLLPGPLFVFANGRPLRKDALVQHMQQALSSAGIDAGKYIGHSFRIGAATTAAAAGIEDSTIQTLGRWRSDSYQRYIRLQPEQLAPISKKLVGGCRAREKQ